MTSTLKDHPISNLFPLMNEQEIILLSMDIKANGQREPIIILDDMILDGRNRYRACCCVDIEPNVVVYRGSNPLNDVISWNLHRRHLNESQRAIIAAKIANMKQGTRSDLEPCAKLRNVVSQPEAAKMLNISRRSLQTAKQIIQNAPHKVAEIEAGTKTITQVRRELNREKIQEFIPEKPSGKYRVIYADPPWKYGDQLTENYGATRFHYPTMSITDLCALPIKDLSEDNAVLFLWVTSPILDECWPVIKAWGFEYKTSFVWDKVKHNMGHYNSVRHEFLLICTRGSCLPDINKLYDSVVTIERSDKHSEKPKEFREMIDELYPNGERIELFARIETDGWKTWGTGE